MDDLKEWMVDHHAEALVLAGDTELEGVEQDGFVNARRHLARY